MRVEQDHYQKQVPYTLNRWFIGLTANSRCRFQEWFEVRILRLNHATTVYLLQEYPFIVILLIVCLSHLQNLILSNIVYSPLHFNPIFPISVIFHVFANPLLNVQHIFVRHCMVVNVPVLSTFTIFIPWSWVVVHSVETWFTHLPYVSFIHSDKLV